VSDAPRRRAVFLDRDGTLIEDVHYLNDPARVTLVRGAAEAVRALRERGWATVVVTNQSGIARGLVTPAQFDAVTARLDALLAERGATLDATYHCPHLPELTGPCACRKPGPAMYERAARELGLDLAGSLYVGDRWRDVAPALLFGGRGVLVPSPDTPDEDVERATIEASVVESLADVVAIAQRA
jgi:histidinol-phosphate phosphatase family protein